MEEEKGKVFWLKKRKGEKDLLVFWAGDPKEISTPMNSRKAFLRLN